MALGDSYASDVGVPPYDDDGCKRVVGAYTRQVASQTGKSLNFGAYVRAYTKDFYRPGEEVAQFDHLDVSTNLATFSTGGNDAGFSTLFSRCITAAPFITCSGNKEASEQVDGVISTLAGRATRAGITSYDTPVADIAAYALGATVIVVDYPRMSTPQGADQTPPAPGRRENITKIDQRWISAKTSEINTAAKAAAQHRGYRLADPSDSFAGHELHDKQSSWFDGLISDGRFHSNTVSHKAIADSIMGVLQEQPAAAQELPAATQAQVNNTCPAGSFALVHDGDQLALDASASTDSGGTIVSISWYIQRVDGSEEILTGTQVTTTVLADKQASITTVITDNQGKEDFTTQIASTA